MNEDTTNSRIWRITVELIVPMGWRREASGEVEQIKGFTRLLPCAFVYPDLTVALRAPEDWPDGRQPAPMGYEVLPFVADVIGENGPMEAVAQVEAYLDSILDWLAFGLYAAISIGQVWILDITPPVSVGDQRDEDHFGYPPFGVNINGINTQSVVGSTFVSFQSEVRHFDSRTSALLRWFHKALGTNLLHDKFMFLWITLEILCDLSGTSVKEPYLARCGHLIKSCPECGKETSKEVRGQTIQQFLVDTLKVDRQVARQLWAMRQVMHGAVDFNSPRLQDLPNLTGDLQRAVVIGIRTRIEVPDDVPPVVLEDKGPFRNPASGLTYSREITAYDIQPLIANSKNIQQEPPT